MLGDTTLNWDLSAQPDTIELKAQVFPCYPGEDGRNAIQNVTWKSSSPKVADFEADGVLKIKKTGSTTITVTAADGSNQKVTFKLNVVKTVTGLQIVDQKVESGKTLNLAQKITVTPADATNKKLTWSITGGDAWATLTATGSFRAKKVTAEQRVEVTVRPQDGGPCPPVTFTVTIIP